MKNYLILFRIGKNAKLYLTEENIAEIYKIVITGGPCLGKSTAMSKIQNEFTDLGYKVLFIPKTATELITGGVAPWNCKSRNEYQKYQLLLQIENEKIVYKAAKSAEELYTITNNFA